MKTNLAIFAVVLLLLSNSCKKDDHYRDNLPYYQFTDDDKTKCLITNYIEGKNIVYKNQKNDEIKFKIITSQRGQAVYSTGTFWGSYVAKEFYYDRQQIELQTGESLPLYEILLQRYPFDSNYNIYPNVEEVPTFRGYITFPAWNVYPDTVSLDKSIRINFDLPITTKTINGKTYSKVLLIQSGSTQTLEAGAVPGGLPQNVNKIYYDENYGIIEFDDVNGNLWQLQ